MFQCSRGSVIVTFSRYWHRVREAASAGGPPLRCLEPQQNCQLETLSVNYKTFIHSFLHSLFLTSILYEIYFYFDLHSLNRANPILKWQTKVHQIQIRKLLLWWMVNGILPSSSNSVANCQLSLKCRNANCTYLTIVHANFPHSEFIFSVGDCPTCQPRDWRLLMKCRTSIKIKARDFEIRKHWGWLDSTLKNKSIRCRAKFNMFVSLLDGSILRRSTRLLHDSSSSNEIAHDGRGYKRFHSSSLWWV